MTNFKALFLRLPLGDIYQLIFAPEELPVYRIVNKLEKLAPQEPPNSCMANTFSQIYLQFVFSVKQRECLIAKEHKEELHKYITGLVQNRKAKMLAIHCMPDHMH
jgi:hypothetical protein